MGIRKILSDLWYGKTDVKENENSQAEKPNAQMLQEAVERDMQTAQTQAQLAGTQVAAVREKRKELEGLVRKSEVIHSLALKEQRAGNEAKAKKLLALKMSVDEQLKNSTEQYEEADMVARKQTKEAQNMIRKAREAESKLPGKVLQLKMNEMLEESHRLAREVKALPGKSSFDALAGKIELETTRLTASALIEEGGMGVDEEIENILKEAEFGEAYQNLLTEAASSNGSETKLLDDPAAKARKLLLQPIAGGVLVEGILSGDELSSGDVVDAEYVEEK